VSKYFIIENDTTIDKDRRKEVISKGINKKAGIGNEKIVVASNNYVPQWKYYYWV